MSQEIYEKIYAGLIGMDAGMRLGAPVENPYWTYERLREHYGDIRGYLRTHRNHTADDDVNGPFILVRALTDGDLKEEVTPEKVGEAWLNYTRFGKGMFWWGGEDVSTEHRAYMNLRRGLVPPASGSAENNGIVAAEQIGGQIFVDTWGLVWPGRPEKAAACATAAARVSHDGNGVYGGAFMAACVAAAFCAKTVEEVIEAGLSVIPEDCDYRRVVDAVRAFHTDHPDDFRAARDYVEAEWGHDKFPGGWHIIPNAGICLVGLLYGGGDLGRSIEIAVMSGFDTDCNASNIGTILGVLNGIPGVPERYRAPINDTVVISSVSGCLNMVDLPSLAKELYAVSRVLAGEEAAGEEPRGGLCFDFELPGATHGLELSDRAAHSLRNIAGEAHTGERCLELMIDGKNPCPADLWFTACFTRSDLDDERYDPVFSPRVYPGETVSCFMKSRQIAPARVTVTPFVVTAMGAERFDLEPVVLSEGTWQEIRFTVPDLLGDQAHRVGWRITQEPEGDVWGLGFVYIDDITVSGRADFSVDFSIQREEFGQITPFSFSDCDGGIEDGALVLTARDEPTATGAQAFTGDYYMRDASVEVYATARTGESALVILRGQGTRRYYALGLNGTGRAAILRYGNGAVEELATAAFAWEAGREYKLQAAASGETLRLSVDGEEILSAKDDRYSFGMVGFGMSAAGESLWRDPRVCGIIGPC